MNEPQVVELPAGTRFNSYQVEKLLGHGAMGAAYLVRDVVLARPVAVKVMLGDAANDVTLLERFRREAHAGALVDSENVVKVFEAGRIVAPSIPLHGKPFIAMQYVDGAGLDALLETHGRLPAHAATAIALGMARGLLALHGAGVIHRDVKPANALLCHDGRVKVADLGLAKLLRGANGAPPPPDLTAPGLAIGSAAYMSPEQAQALALDGKTDVYALGVTFYELLTGSLPFMAEDPFETAMQRLYVTPPAPRKLVPEIPPEIERACLTLLTREPAERPDAGAARDLLERLVPGDRSEELAGLLRDPRATLLTTGARRWGLERARPGNRASLAGVGSRWERRTKQTALFALASFLIAVVSVIHYLVTAPVPAEPVVLERAIATRRAAKVRDAAVALKSAQDAASRATVVEAARDAERLVSAFEIQAQGLDLSQPLDRLLDQIVAGAGSQSLDDEVKAAATLIAAVERGRVPEKLLLPEDAKGAAAEKLARTLSALGLARPGRRE